MAAGIENIIAGQGGAKQAAPAQQGIADNFDAFLTLLTTQLQNQSPLDPLDTNQFTQQLVQFASVEQQIKSNDALESLWYVAAHRCFSPQTGFVDRLRRDGKSAARMAGL